MGRQRTSTQECMAGRTPSASANDGPPRPGPRPLPLYLATAATTWLSSYAGSAGRKHGSLDWKPDSTEAASSLRRQLAVLEAARAAAEADPAAATYTCRAAGAARVVR